MLRWTHTRTGACLPDTRPFAGDCIATSIIASLPASSRRFLPNWLIRGLSLNHRLGDRWFRPTIPISPMLRMTYRSITKSGRLYITRSLVEERLLPSMGLDLGRILLCGLNVVLRQPSPRRLHIYSGEVETRGYSFNLNIMAYVNSST